MAWGGSKESETHLVQHGLAVGKRYGGRPIVVVISMQMYGAVRGVSEVPEAREVDSTSTSSVERGQKELKSGERGLTSNVPVTMTPCGSE